MVSTKAKKKSGTVKGKPVSSVKKKTLSKGKPSVSKTAKSSKTTRKPIKPTNTMKKTTKAMKSAAPKKKNSKPKKVIKAKTADATKVSAKQKLRNFQLSPLDDRVLVLRQGFALKTAGGLYIPETVQEKPVEGTVMAVGKGRRSKKGLRRNMDVQVGDRILFSAYAGTALDWDGQEVLILREDEVLGVLT